jgi:hypothetical protein
MIAGMTQVASALLQAKVDVDVNAGIRASDGSASITPTHAHHVWLHRIRRITDRQYSRMTEQVQTMQRPNE